MSHINITHNGTLDLSIGANRHDTHWRNKEMLWSDLVQRLSKEHRTTETHAEYLKASKSRQDEIKDIGGFVGGYLTGGRRKKGAVTQRQLITLDADFASPSLWADFCLQYSCAGLVYSTHKHTPQHPRLRLVIPLSRPVMCDEYIAIGRRIAGDLGIEQFDNTGFQPERLMYWPSTPKDGVFDFFYQDADWLDADEVLGTYRDWQDASEWPVSERYSAAIARGIKKQGDPLGKPGVVGAFCRQYNIHEAIEKFLADVYEPVEGSDDRYTYKEGSTAGGMITYDDRFAYSHHSTDPISEKLCNAFDLVRLHKFGDRDSNVKDETPGNKLPSFLAMLDFATDDKGVRRLIAFERFQAAQDDFKDVPRYEEKEADLSNTEDSFEYPELGELPEYNDDWLAELDVDRKGNTLSTIDNVVLILRNDQRLRFCFAYNKFENREVAMRPLPWRSTKGDDRYLVDTDDASLRHLLEKEPYGVTGTAKIKDALDIVTRENAFHPVRSYLDRVRWDGLPRLETLFIDYLGAEDNPYVRAVTKKALVACVARIYQPGVKFDNMLTLIGDQGIGKSTILNRLGGQWFSDSFNFHMLGKKEAAEQLQGAWLVEVGELTGLKKADLEAAKAFLSKREDRYRVAYGKRVDYFPRQCVFFGSTNNRDFLRDITGNRRFWPVDTRVQPPTKSVFEHLTKDEVAQVWAEAVHAWKGGEPLYLSRELEAMAVEVQREHTEKDDRIGMVQEYLEMLLPDNWEEMDVFERRGYMADSLSVRGTRQRTQVCAAEIWCELFGGTVKDMTSGNTKYIHDLMKQVEGWKRVNGVRKYNIYGRQKTYIRVNGGPFWVNGEGLKVNGEGLKVNANEFQ